MRLHVVCDENDLALYEGEDAVLIFRESIPETICRKKQGSVAEQLLLHRGMLFLVIDYELQAPLPDDFDKCFDFLLTTKKENQKYGSFSFLEGWDQVENTCQRLIEQSTGRKKRETTIEILKLFRHYQYEHEAFWKGKLEELEMEAFFRLAEQKYEEELQHNHL